jgi:hypothetical protein
MGLGRTDVKMEITKSSYERIENDFNDIKQSTGEGFHAVGDFQSNGVLFC